MRLLISFTLSMFLLIPVKGTTSPIKDCQVKEQYYKDRERGWYFREKCEELPKKEKDEKKKEEDKIDWAKVGDPKYLDTLDAEKFRKLMERVKEEAVYDPKPDKVHAYMKIQDYARVKSVKFAYVWRDVLLKHPELDMTTKNPGNVYGAQARAEILSDEKTKIMREMKDTVGMFFFVSGECPYCHRQNKIIDKLRNEYGMAVKIISSDYCDNSFKDCSVQPNMFEHFQVKATPTMISVMRDAQDRPIFQPIGTGIITLDDVVDRLVFYYRYHKTGQHPSF